MSEVRNFALSVIPTEQHQTVVRFMFLSLLSLGMATAAFLFVVEIFVLGGGFLVASHTRLFDAFSPAVSNFAVEAVLLLFGAGLFIVLFMIRRVEFFDRSRRVPFDMANAVFWKARQASNDSSRDHEVGHPARQESVYLAGGHHSDWQSEVITAVPGFKYFNPREHGLKDPSTYTAWDLSAIRQCDVVFSYFEASNPSGYGLSLEIGYARALGKHIIFVDEKSVTSEDTARYLQMIRCAASVFVDDLESGIEYLRQRRELVQVVDEPEG